MSRQDDYADVASGVWPYLLKKIERLSRGVAASTGTIEGGAPSPHALGSLHHEGTLGDSQAPQFLKVDGTRSLTGNLAASAGVTIDGVDISAHAADPAAHHAPVTAGDGIDVTGQAVAVDVTDVIDTNYGLTENANDIRLNLSGTWAGLEFDTGALRVKRNAAFAWTGAHSWTQDLQVDADIDFVGGQSITTSAASLNLAPAVNLTLNPTSGIVELYTGKAHQATTHSDLVTGITGFSLFDRGGNQYQLTTFAGKFDELYARVFVADEVRMDRGEEYWSKSYGIVETDFVIPEDEATVDVWFEESAGLGTAKIFTAGDWLMCRVIDWTTGIDMQTIWWEVVDGDGAGTNDYLAREDQTGSTPDRQQWQLRRKVGGTTGKTIRKGSVFLDAGVVGQGWVHLSALAQDNGPFLQIGSQTGAGTTTTAPVFSNYVRMGNLKGIGGISADTWGFAAAKNLGTAIGSGYEGIVLDSVDGLRLFNADIAMYNGSVQTVDIATDGSVKFGSDVSAAATTGLTFTASGANAGDLLLGAAAGNYLSWDQSTGAVALKGSITITGGSGIGSLTDANLDNIADSASYKKTTPNEKTGASRGYTALNSSNQVVTSVIPASAVTPSGAGLYLDSTHMGYYDGSAWKTYIDNTGKFYFSGTGTTGLQWDGTKLKGISSSVEQWYADATDGKLYAGAGAVTLDVNGISLIGYDTFQAKNALTWNTGAYRLSQIWTNAQRLYPQLFIEAGGSSAGYAGSVFIQALKADNTVDAWIGVSDTISLSGATSIVGTLSMPNNTALTMEDSGGTARSVMYMSTGNDLIVGYGVQSGNYVSLAPGGGTCLAVYSDKVACSVSFQMNGSDAITSNPPAAGSSGGWKASLYSTSFALGVAASTVAVKTAYWLSVFCGTNPASDASSTVPDSNAHFSAGSAGIFASGPLGGGWTNATYAGVWQSYDTTNNHKVSYKIFGDIVMLRGLAGTSSTDGNATAIFTLPAGYRPAKIVILPVRTNNGTSADMGHVAIQTSGAVNFAGNATGWCSLDGVFFSTGAAV